MRGMNIAPQACPAQVCATRIQQELFSSSAVRRSQGNFTLIRPYLSVVISCPDSPVTLAVCGPRMDGRGVMSARRNGRAPGTARSTQRKVSMIVVPVLHGAGLGPLHAAHAFRHQVLLVGGGVREVRRG